MKKGKSEVIFKAGKITGKGKILSSKRNNINSPKKDNPDDGVVVSRRFINSAVELTCSEFGSPDVIIFNGVKYFPRK